MSAPPSDSLVFSGSGEEMAAGAAIGGNSASISRAPTDSSGDAPVIQAVALHAAEPQFGFEAGGAEVPGSLPCSSVFVPRDGGMTLAPHGSWTMGPGGVDRVPVASTIAEPGVPQIPLRDGPDGACGATLSRTICPTDEQLIGSAPSLAGQIVMPDQGGTRGPTLQSVSRVAEQIGGAVTGCGHTACEGEHATFGTRAEERATPSAPPNMGGGRVPVAAPDWDLMMAEFDRARRDRDWAWTELHAMSGERATIERNHQAEVQSCVAAAQEHARAKYQAKYDSTMDDFQRQCDQHIMEIHEQKVALERMVVELRAELERRAGDAAWMREQLVAANDRAARLSEELASVQARSCHHAPVTAGRSALRTVGAGTVAPSFAPSANDADGRIRVQEFSHPLLWKTSPPGHGDESLWTAAPASNRAGGVGCMPVATAAAGMSGACRVPVAPAAAAAAAMYGTGAHGVFPQGLPDQECAPYHYAWRRDEPMPRTVYHKAAPAPAGHMQTDTTKRREADHFSVPPIPNVVSVTAWKREVREAVAAASANPDLPSVYRWVVEAEEKMADPDATLGYSACPPQFRTLDSKFLQALANRIKDAGMPALANKHQELSDDAMARGDGVLTGRRVYYAILQHLRVSNGLEMRNSLVTLQGIEWPGDEHMERFSHVINDYAREAIRDGIDEAIIMGIVYEKMLKSKSLEIQLNLFRLRPEDDPERSWKGLLRIIHEKVEQERNDRLRAERTLGVDRLMRGGGRPQKQEPIVKSAAPAPRGVSPSGRSQLSSADNGQRQAHLRPLGVCWFHNHGGCRLGDQCKFEHRLVRPNQKARTLEPRNADVGANAATHSAGQGSERGDGDAGRGRRGRSSDRVQRGIQGADSNSGSPRSLGSGPGRGQPRMCMQFQSTGYCRWGDACSNLHAGDMADVQRAQSASVAREVARQGQRAA